MTFFKILLNNQFKQKLHKTYLLFETYIKAASKQQTTMPPNKVSTGKKYLQKNVFFIITVKIYLKTTNLKYEVNIFQ